MPDRRYGRAAAKLAPGAEADKRDGRIGGPLRVAIFVGFAGGAALGRYGLGQVFLEQGDGPRRLGRQSVVEHSKLPLVGGDERGAQDRGLVGSPGRQEGDGVMSLVIGPGRGSCRSRPAGPAAAGLRAARASIQWLAKKGLARASKSATSGCSAFHRGSSGA